MAKWCSGWGELRAPPDSIVPIKMQKSAWPRSVRTTLDLDDDLLAETKALAAREQLSLTRLIEQGLALRLRRAAGATDHAARTSLPVHAGRGGLSAAVADPCRNTALLDAADGLPPP